MAVQPQYLAYVLEQLEAMPALRPNRMFGGIGLYSGGVFFGLIDDDTLYFKTGPANVAQYLTRNMPKFMPFPDKTGAVMGYHQVPADIIEDAESLVSWARQSVAVQLSAKAGKVKPARPSTNPRGKTPPSARARAPSKRRRSTRRT